MYVHGRIWKKIHTYNELIRKSNKHAVTNLVAPAGGEGKAPPETENNCCRKTVLFFRAV